MAGGAGFVSDMIKSIRNNRNLKDNPYYKGENYKAKDKSKKLIDPRQPTPELLHEIRLKAKADENADRKKMVIVLLISAVILITLLSVLLALF